MKRLHGLLSNSCGRCVNLKIKIMKTTILVFAAASLFVVCGCKKKEQVSNLIPPTPALLTKSIQKEIHAYISTLGTTAAYESVNIVPQVSGQIVKINFMQGANVKAGQVLVEIDSRPYVAEVTKAEGNLRQALAQLKIDQLEVERNRKLAKNNYVDKQTFDSYLAKVEVDEGQVKVCQAALDTAKINLDWCSIKAPVDGKVGLYNINLGNVVAAGTSTITSIQYVDKLYVDFVIPSQRLYDVLTLMKQRGGKLNILVSYIEDDMSSSHKRQAEVEIVLNKIRYETGTAVLRGVLKNDDHLFWPDQPVKVALDLKKIDKAVLIPDGTISTGPNGEYVYVATPYKGGVYIVKQTPVKLGQLYAGDMRFVEGVKAGEFVVVRVSQLRLQAGPFVYSATEQGLIIGEDGKPITNIDAMKKFMYDSSMIVAPLRADFMKEAEAKKSAAMRLQNEVREATESVKVPAQDSLEKAAGAKVSSTNTKSKQKAN